MDSLTLLHSEWPKLYGVLAIQSVIGLFNAYIIKVCYSFKSKQSLVMMQRYHFQFLCLTYFMFSVYFRAISQTLSSCESL